LSFSDFWRNLRGVVTPNRLSTAVDLVKAAANMALSDKDKRALVILELMKIPGVSENMARILTELAVKYVKDNQ
jgi:hypothetical protein